MALSLLFLWERKSQKLNLSRGPALVPSKRSKFTKMKKYLMNHPNNDLIKMSQDLILDTRVIVQIKKVKRKNHSQHRKSILKIMQWGIWNLGREGGLKWITWSIAKNNKRRIHFGHNRDKTTSVISILETMIKKTTFRVVREEMSLIVISIKHNQSMKYNL